jgi:flagellar biosynthesis anti-sigma factor FlgM
MNLNIQNQGQSEIDTASFSSASLSSAEVKTGSAKSSASNLSALNAAQDTASINSAATQLSGDLPIRQDRVDALRTQMETGTYTVNAHAVATAMFQNLFRS